MVVSVTPYILDGFVFVSVSNGYVYVFDIEGNLKWKENVIIDILKKIYHINLDEEVYSVSSSFLKNYLLLSNCNYGHIYLFKLKPEKFISKIL